MRIEKMPVGEEFVFNLIEDDGSQKECVLLFTYWCRESGKTFVAYLDDVDEDGVLYIEAKILDEDHGNALYPITDDKEYDMMAARIHHYWYDPDAEKAPGEK